MSIHLRFVEADSPNSKAETLLDLTFFPTDGFSKSLNSFSVVDSNWSKARDGLYR